MVNSLLFVSVPLSTLGVRTILASQNEFVNALSVLSRSSLKSDGAKSSLNELTEFTNKSLWYRAFLHGEIILLLSYSCWLWNCLSC